MTGTVSGASGGHGAGPQRSPAHGERAYRRAGCGAARRSATNCGPSAGFHADRTYADIATGNGAGDHRAADDRGARSEADHAADDHTGLHGQPAEQMLTGVTQPVGWGSRRVTAMGSMAEVLVWGPDAEQLADWATDEIARCEQSWSRFLPDSDLCALNASAGCGAVPVAPLLWETLTIAQRAHAETDGLFDPTVLGSLLALGYDRSFPFAARIDISEPVTAAAPGFERVELDPINRTVSLPLGTGLDLGGIGKGLAADRVVEGLIARGAHSACVSMGGDVRVAGPGPDPDDAWIIHVEDPRSERDAFTFPLVDEALAQSSTMFRRWNCGTESVHHLIDPRTGSPSTSGVVCAVVTARHTWRAETLAKAALVAGTTDGIALLERARVDGWLLDEVGVVHATTDVADVMWASAQQPIAPVEETPPCSRS